MVGLSCNQYGYRLCGDRAGFRGRLCHRRARRTGSAAMMLRAAPAVPAARDLLPQVMMEMTP
jgi:hypothetical protein